MGNITTLQFNLGQCDIDAIEIGKRGANDLALKDIKTRTTELISDINAAEGIMAQYATTTWVSELGYQTESSVNQILDTFNTTYKVSATLQQFTDNGTLERKRITHGSPSFAASFAALIFGWLFLPIFLVQKRWNDLST